MDREESSLILNKPEAKPSSDLARRIEEERSSAAKFGYSPDAPVPLGGRFRVEGLTAVAAPPEVTRAASMLPSAARPGLLRIENPFLELVPQEELRSSIDRLVHSVTREKRDDLKPKLLDRYMSLAATASDHEELSTLQNRVFSAVFGADHAKRSEGGRAGRQAKHSK